MVTNDAPLLDIPIPETKEGITQAVLALNKNASSERLRFIMDSLVKHLHTFAVETNLSTDEWMTAIQFLTRTGKTCTDIRQEFILLSDVLGLSAVVDLLTHPTVGSCTESTVLGPFFTEDAVDVPQGGSIASEGKGDYLLVEGCVFNSKGQPIAGAKIETWETDASGLYDTQYENRTEPDCRGRVTTNNEGYFKYRAVVPVAYPIPGDGPVGDLLKALGRHNYRPAHLHMMIEAPGYTKLVSALYPEGDKYITSDAVFGVKKSLVVRLATIDSEKEARAHGFPNGTSFKLLRHDFILASPEETMNARERLAAEAAARSSSKL